MILWISSFSIFNFTVSVIGIFVLYSISGKIPLSTCIGDILIITGFVLTSFISPIAQDRLLAKQIIGDEDFIEVFIDCPLEICEKRDVKGLYAKARKGEIKNFTGIDSPYEIPLNPDITINTAEKSISECANIIVDTIKMKIKE